MKVLLSAFACEPGLGGESAVGAGVARLAAEHHEVWVLTRPADAAALRSHPAGGRLHVVAVDVTGPARRLEGRNRVLDWVHYHRWQAVAGARAVELDRAIDFDVVHHATYATYWAEVGVRRVAKPLVIGPVGGAYLTPVRLLGELGAKGLAEDAARLVRRLAGLRPSVRSGLREAEVVLAQNAATAARMPGGARVRMLSNALIVDVGNALAEPLATTRRPEVAVVGKLIPLKGGPLAVRAVPHLPPEVTLCFYGTGPDRPRIEARASRLGVADRVRFAGHLGRDELFRQVATAGAVLHPSLHDEAPLAVAEALSLGTPVVTLATSGPAEVAAHWPAAYRRAVTPSWPEPTARALARAARELLESPPPVATAPHPPDVSFAAELLEAYERAASAR